MSDQDRDHQPNEPGMEENTNTADVREAIERAKEAGESGNVETQPAPEATTILPESAEAATASGLTPQEHAVTNTEAMRPVQGPVTITGNVEMPSAVEQEPATPVAPAAPVPPVMTSEHPMAALYMQQPDPPVMKSNRLAGVLISLLATLGFGVVYAGLIALWIAPKFPPSSYLQEGLYPYLVSLGFVLPCAAFFVTMMILVLVFNRAGWWVYTVLGFLVAAAVWVTAGIGYSMSPQLVEEAVQAEHNITRYLEFALTIPALLAALAGREAAVWFGAWIGARGRRMKLKNRDAQTEYEEKLAELKAPQTL